MYFFRRVADLQTYLRQERTNNRSVGFVPTMGALHEGHLELVRRAREQNQVTVCSIFVNPTQFNDPEDLRKYPRTPGKDLELLARVGCEVAFLPAVEEVYPRELNTRVDIELDGLDERLEGEHRPGHFAGVLQVVKRLLDIVEPTNLYLGQKDYQQLTILREMVRQLALPTEVTMVPTVREDDGLAMSSRNLRLSAEARAVSPRIYRTLEQASLSLLGGEPVEQVRERALRTLSEVPLRAEYFAVVDGRDLRPIEHLHDAGSVVICTAVWAGDVRLIDNVIVK